MSEKECTFDFSWWMSIWGRKTRLLATGIFKRWDSICVCACVCFINRDVSIERREPCQSMAFSFGFLSIKAPHQVVVDGDHNKWITSLWLYSGILDADSLVCRCKNRLDELAKRGKEPIRERFIWWWWKKPNRFYSHHRLALRWWWWWWCALLFSSLLSPFWLLVKSTTVLIRWEGQREGNEDKGLFQHEQLLPFPERKRTEQQGLFPVCLLWVWRNETNKNETLSRRTPCSIVGTRKQTNSTAAQQSRLFLMKIELTFNSSLFFFFWNSVDLNSIESPSKRLVRSERGGSKSGGFPFTRRWPSDWFPFSRFSLLFESMTRTSVKSTTSTRNGTTTTFGRWLYGFCLKLNTNPGPINDQVVLGLLALLYEPALP